VPSRALSPPATMCGRAGRHPPALVQVLQVSAVEVHLPRPRGSDPCTAMQSHDHRYSHIRAIILFLHHGSHGDSDQNYTRSANQIDRYVSSWRFSSLTERNGPAITISRFWFLALHGRARRSCCPSDPNQPSPPACVTARKAFPIYYTYSTGTAHSTAYSSVYGNVDPHCFELA
jgi:hypothetical protein